MAIPKYNEFFPSVITALADGKPHNKNEIVNFCAKEFQISAAEQLEEYPKKRLKIFPDRVGWAITYLKKAGLIQSPTRARYQLTEEGRKVIPEAKSVTLNYLMKYPDFVNFYRRNQSNSKETNIPSQTDVLSPLEQISNAIEELNSSLASDLMEEVMKLSPYDFEKLLLKLLIAMGYGSNLSNGAQLTKKSGDEGIDGILAADKFGFDSVYVQAKQWKPDSTIGREEIQKFGGALMGQGASKGLFITTAKFSENARDYTEKNIQTKIVLVDGNLLAKLMIEYNIGVSTVETFFIKKIDSDFFDDFE